MIISFAWTTFAVINGTKTVTRRVWADRTLATWHRAWDRGELIHDAYDRLPYRGGKLIGRIRLTCRPYREALLDMPEEDVAAEGGLWPTKHEFIRGFRDRGQGDETTQVAVVRFELVTG